MTDDVGKWLSELGLARYAPAFAENDVDSNVLAELDEEDLEKLGIVSLGHRKKLLKAIAALGAVTPAVRADTAADARDTPLRAAKEAERRQITLLFCDLVGSTALSRQLDPEDLRGLMRRYQDAVASAMTRYGGHVAQYLGDGVLAYFGWPQAFEDQADRAVRAGLDAVQAVETLHGTGARRLMARVGVETGEVVVGDLVGEISRDAEAVSGETPNLAARLQQAAMPGDVVIGPMTRRLVGEAFVLEDRGAQRLKGFDEPVATWAVIGEVRSESRFETSRGDSTTSLFGREHELGMLRDRWEQCKADGGQVVVLSGEAGIGKSRLVQSLRDHVSGEQCFRLRYQCSPHHLNSAFYPIIQRLERAARFAEEDGDGEKLDKIEALLRLSQTDIGAVAPYIAILLGLPAASRYETPALEPRQTRERIFEALIGQVLDLARMRPVLFILEDAHWVDPTTEALVGRLIDAIVGVPVFMLITYRPDYTPPWERQSYCTSIPLNRLSRGHAADIVHSVAGEELPAQVTERIVARADGIPLYLEELTKSVLEAGEATGASVVVSKIPATLQALLAARLDRLAKAKEIAQIGAVIGREFPYQLVTALAGMNPPDVDRDLERLVESGLAYRRGAHPDTTYIFKHALIQDAAYDGLLLSRRRDLHSRAVSAIEELYSANLDEHVELLAYHAQRGELWNKSLNYCLLAGRKANDRSAYSEALNFLEAGLRVAKNAPEDESNLRAALDIRLSMRPSLGAFGQYGRFLDVLSEAEVAAERLGDDYTRAHVNFEKTHVLYQTGYAEEGVELGRKAVAMARAVDHRRLIVGATANLAMALFFRGELREALAVAIQHASDLKTKFRHDQLGTTGTSSVNWLSNMAAMNTLLGELQTARRFSDEASMIAEETKKPFDIAMAGHWNGFVCISMGDLPAALRTLERSFQLVDQLGLDFLYPWAGIHLGTACALSGEHDRADVLIAGGANKASQLGLVLVHIWAVALSAKAKILAGKPEDAIAAATNALVLARKHGFQWLQVLALNQLGHGNALLGKTHFKEARESYSQAISLAGRIEARLLLADAECGMGQTYASAGRHDTASEHVRRARELYCSMELLSGAQNADALLATLP